MTINLDDYRATFEKAAPALKDTLDATFHEASRVMSPAALQAWLDGAKGLCSLGRGGDLGRLAGGDAAGGEGVRRGCDR